MGFLLPLDFVLGQLFTLPLPVLQKFKYFYFFLSYHEYEMQLNKNPF